MSICFFPSECDAYCTNIHRRAQAICADAQIQVRERGERKMSRTWKEIFQLLKSLRTDNLDSSSSDTPLARDRKGEKFIRVVDQAVALQERTRQALEMQKKATIAHLSFDPPSHFDHDEYDTSNVHLNLVARFYASNSSTGAFGTTSEGFPLLALTPSSSTQSVVSEHEECNLSLIFHALDFVEI
ncbi:hypothetical protein BT69DRAFT_1304484, partial [Atractiella rhizophila]